MEILGSQILDLVGDSALIPAGNDPFKGNIDITKLKNAVKEYGPDRIAFIRMEATTNLIGGQPFSMENLREVKKVARDNGILLILDGSLIGENAYFIKKREEGYTHRSIRKSLRR